MSEVDYEEAMKMVMEEKKVYMSLLGWQEKIRGATYNYNFYSTKMSFTRDTGFEMCPVCREAVEDPHIVSLKFLKNASWIFSIQSMPKLSSHQVHPPIYVGYIGYSYEYIYKYDVTPNTRILPGMAILEGMTVTQNSSSDERLLPPNLWGV